MAELRKVRVQLLNESTGAVEEEVNVLTSAECVTFADGETFEQKLEAGKLTGPKGDPGQTGQTGANGADGATWLFGTAVPSPQGKTGDFYLKTDTFDVYSKATGSWVKTGNIKGATGAQGAQGPIGPAGAKGDRGAQGPAGPAGPTGAQGPKGDTPQLAFTIKEDGHLYVTIS